MGRSTRRKTYAAHSETSTTRVLRLTDAEIAADLRALENIAWLGDDCDEIRSLILKLRKAKR